MSEENPVVALMRDGKLSCRDCIRDSDEHSIWTEDVMFEDILRDLNIKLILANEAKSTDKCSRCGRQLVR